MKNRWGEIATLLTLGLVIIGGLITLGASLFVSNQKNNLASNSRAGSTSTPICAYTNQDDCARKCKGTCTAACSNKAGLSTLHYGCLANLPTPISTATSTTGGVGSGGGFQPLPTEGFNKGLCGKTAGLEFACCVEYYNQCGTDKSSYTWYGCTGQYCKNTIIKQSNGPGHLVACPSGIDESANKSCSVVAATSTQAVSPNNCTTRNYQYSSSGYEYACNNKAAGCATSFSPAYEKGKALSCGDANKICCKKPKSTVTPTNTPTGGLSSGEGTGTCKATHETITVSGQTVTVEKNSDLFPAKEEVNCGHILVKQPDNDDITVFRECPGLLQGSACVYSCFKENRQVNCAGTSDSPVYDSSVAGKSLITIFNNKSYSLDISVGTTNPTKTVIYTTTVSAGSSISGTLSKCTNNFNNKINYSSKKTGSNELPDVIPVSAKCDGFTKIIIK